MSDIDRVLELGGDPSERGDPDVRLHTLGLVLLLHSCVETWFWTLDLERFALGVTLLAGSYTACLAVGLSPRYRRLALGSAATVALVQVLWTFPFVANHTFLRALALGSLAFVGLDSLRDRRLAHAALGWMAVVVLFYTGFQKLAYGTYFQGQYLGCMASLTDRFGRVFEWVVPAAEFTRLKGIGEPVPGAGPYAVHGPAFVVLSNLVYIAEIGLAFALLLPRTRRAAVWATLGLIFFIQLGAREVFFGLLFCNLILVLHPRDVNRKLLPLTAGLYLLALLLKLSGWGGTLS